MLRKEQRRLKCGGRKGMQSPGVDPELMLVWCRNTSFWYVNY